MCNKVTYRNWVFPDPKITMGTIGLEQSLPMTELGIDTFEVEVKCQDKSILNFEQNEPVHYFHRKQQMGIFYVQSIERVSPDHYSIFSISTLGLLEQMDFYGGIYTGQTVQEVVSAICGNIPVIIKTNLQKIKLYGWLGISSARRALQQVLFAIGANLITDQNGVLRIENLWDGISAVIPASRIYRDGNSVKQENPVTTVTVLEHQYIPGTERKDLFEGTTIEGQRIPFSEPVSQIQAEGFTILESGANYAVVSAGNGKLTGCPYIHTTLEVTKPVTNAPIRNEERIEDATIVSLVNSNAVAELMTAYYKCRETIAADVVLQGEHPGQVVQMLHPWDKEMVKMAIATSNVSISSVLKGSITGLVNFKPKQVESVITYDHHEVITQSGTWTVPKGCTKVRAILIGGGNKGDKGTNGTSGGSGGQNKAGAAGHSGKAGKGGSGGKVLDISLDVIPGAQINVVIGVGGRGSNYIGGDTIFGEHSSAEGAVSAVGYTDLIDGTVYAKSGTDGGVPASHGPGGYTGIAVSCRFIRSGFAFKYDKTFNVGTTGYITDSFGQKWYNKGTALSRNLRHEDGTTIDWWTIFDSIKGGYDGISPEDRAAATVPGCGGDGGHAGGGGGGASGTSIKNVGSTIGSVSELTLKIDAIDVPEAAGGKGGTGSMGGDGANGCIILYYGVETSVRSGILTDKNYNFLSDKSGRLIIV